MGGGRASMGASGRSLVVFAGATLALSTAFPIIASLLPPELLPRWVGVVDVALAFAVLILALRIDLRSRGRVRDDAVRVAYRFYRASAAFPLALLVVFFLAGDAIRWDVLLPGLAWRAWVLLYVFPGAYALWAQGRREG
jgi:hypothetical protein